VIHAFRLGPFQSSGGVQAYAYVGLVEGGEPRIHEAPTDRGGLERLKGEALEQPISCEPALAEVGKPLGLESAPLPPAVLAARAVIAYELASGVQHGASKPDAIAAFLKGAAAFWAARSWEVVSPQERLHVAFLEGHAEVDGELSVVGGDGTALPGVALCDARDALGVLARLSGDARAAAALRLASLTVELERDPSWAAEAIQDGYGLARVPTSTRKRGGGVAPMVTQDLLVAGALLEAIAAWTGLEEEGAIGEGTAEAAGMRVVARVGASAQLPSEGLTPVGAAPPKAERPAPAPAGEAAPDPAPSPSPPAPQAAPGPAPEAEAAKAKVPPTLEAPPSSPPEAPGVPPPAAAPPAKPPAAPAKPPAPATPARQPSPPPRAPGARRGERPLGLLARAWRSLRGEGAASKPPRPAAPPARGTPRARPPAPRPPPRPDPAVDGSDPFAPFARALGIALPAEPPALSEADEATAVELAGRVVGAARSAGAELVSFPAVALEIVERVRDPKADARGVAGFIARDPALAADVVSVANSAAFRGVSEVESVHEAVARLGLTEVGRVASAVAARKLLDPKGGTGLFVRAVAVATAAADAALHRRGARSDHAWLGGLLHDVGKALAPQLLVHLATGGGHLTSVAVGERVIERVHVEVGEAAVERWALPAYLREICGHHHDAAVPPEAVDLHLVRLTSALASLGDAALAARAAREIVQSAGALGMDALAVRALATELRLASERAKALAR